MSITTSPEVYRWLGEATRRTNFKAWEREAILLASHHLRDGGPDAVQNALGELERVAKKIAAYQ